MNRTDLRIRPVYHHIRNRIEGRICICFTAYTILLEMERMLKHAKSEITVKRAQELTKNMYQLSYRLPNSRIERSQTLKMDGEQQQLYRIIARWIAKNNPGVPTRKTRSGIRPEQSHNLSKLSTEP
jgi:transposase